MKIKLCTVAKCEMLDLHVRRNVHTFKHRFGSIFYGLLINIEHIWSLLLQRTYLSII